MFNGNKVQLGKLGTFSISISSEGVPFIKEFTAKNIKAVNILLSSGLDFENLIGRAEFNVVASRAVQTTTLKVEKAGETTVDLQAAKTKGGGDEDSTNGSGDTTDNGDNECLPGTSGY